MYLDPISFVWVQGHCPKDALFLSRPCLVMEKYNQLNLATNPTCDPKICPDHELKLWSVEQDRFHWKEMVYPLLSNRELLEL